MLKEIKNFENYIIDENGNIFNKRNLNKKICQWIDNVGYKQIVLYKNGKRNYKRVHILVATAFIPNPEKLPQVNHKDGNKTNNNINNLEWTTNRINTKHGYDNGLYTTHKRKIGVKATNKETKEIIYFDSIRKLSKELNLNRKTVTNILNGTKTTNNYNYEFEYYNI